jgi:hypothetical protein
MDHELVQDGGATFCIHCGHSAHTCALDEVCRVRRARAEALRSAACIREGERDRNVRVVRVYRKERAR